jgi:DNA-binding transcriptional ArsR family regulator
VHAFDVLGDPVRRRILELLASGEHASGEVVEVISAEFGIGQPAVSMQLRVLRDSGFATVRAEGARRLYAIDGGPMAEVDAWLGRFRGFWEQRLDALGTEIARGRRAPVVEQRAPASVVETPAAKAGARVRRSRLGC